MINVGSVASALFSASSLVDSKLFLCSPALIPVMGTVRAFSAFSSF